MFERGQKYTITPALQQSSRLVRQALRVVCTVPVEQRLLRNFGLQHSFTIASGEDPIVNRYLLAKRE